MSRIQRRKLPASFTRIREWLLYDGDPKRPSAPKLWEKDEENYEMLVQLRSLYFQKVFDYHDAMKVMMKEYGISEAQFNRLHHGLIFIFGDLEAESKEFEKQRYKAIQMKILQKALSTNDLKAANTAMSNLIKLGGHDRDEGEKVPLELLNPGVYALVIDDAGKKALAALTEGSAVIDLGEMMRESAKVEDIEHEEVPPGEAATE